MLYFWSIITDYYSLISPELYTYLKFQNYAKTYPGPMQETRPHCSLFIFLITGWLFISQHSNDISYSLTHYDNYSQQVLYTGVRMCVFVGGK